MEAIETVRYKAIIAYDGTHFSGFQIQPNGRTVQGELERVLKKINKGTFVRIHPAGRTDAGVHARGMVIHFDYLSSIPTEGLFKAMNILTSADISINRLEIVENDFHARYHAISKTYTYRVHNEAIRDPFIRNFTLHHPYSLNREKAEQALRVIVGKHDFTSFCSTKTDKEDKVRTVYEASVDVDESTNIWTFTFHGDGFLYNMIRIIMGTVLEIADGR
ncbi:MAG TPA: tRNA pseudouridine(38-40) synthase TruA, partial [Atopostipes sp.]|nr:tRNA pseudouridine(38-40) synthase TruA [Atopostipes sp.]